MRYQKKRNWKYRVYEDGVINLNTYFPECRHDMFEILGKKIYYKKGYCYDGPSGPTIDTDNFLVPSLAHDILFQAMREGLLDRSYFKQANKELRLLCLERGMCSFRAWYVEKCVNAFGSSNIENDIYEVK